MYFCKREDCKVTRTETTSPVEHKWDSGVTVAAKCESGGSVTYTCMFECGTRNVVTINALGHNWGGWVRITDSDCTTKGEEQRACTRTDCKKDETRAVAELGHIWSNDYIVDENPTLEAAGSQSKHCTRSDCDAKDDIQTIPKLDENTPIEYTVAITDPCGDTYKGVATIEFCVGDTSVANIDMTTGGVTKISLGANNYTVKLSGLTAGYFSKEEQYDIYATQPQLTVNLGASLRAQSSGAKYQIGSILCDYTFNYYDAPDGELKTSSFKEILSEYKGILVNFYFNGCQPCAKEMLELVAASTAHPDILILMVNDYLHGNSDDDIKYFQRTYAKNASFWFVNRAKSYALYLNFYNGGLISGFPTSILIDCNGQVVYARSAGMTESAFNNVMKTYILDRYAKLHSDTAATDKTVYRYEAILPSSKFQFV